MESRKIDSLAFKVRDRHIIRVAARTNVRVASCDDRALITAIVEGFWETRLGSSDREAALGITKAISRIWDLVKKAPKVWEALKETLGLNRIDSLGMVEKAKLLGAGLKRFMTEGKKGLKDSVKKMLQTFPLSLFFIPKNKAPGLTDIVARILQKSPRIREALGKARVSALKLDELLKKHAPRLSRVAYAAIFIYVWLNVTEISWDVDFLLNGFTGNISLGELLSSLPESALGLLLASFGVGYGLIPYVIIARIVWLVINKYVEWIPGKGLKILWPSMDVDSPDEMIAIT